MGGKDNSMAVYHRTLLERTLCGTSRVVSVRKKVAESDNDEISYDK
jgi:hypothetical protein